MMRFAFSPVQSGSITDGPDWTDANGPPSGQRVLARDGPTVDGRRGVSHCRYYLPVVDYVMVIEPSLIREAERALSK